MATKDSSNPICSAPLDPNPLQNESDLDVKSATVSKPKWCDNGRADPNELTSVTETLQSGSPLPVLPRLAKGGPVEKPKGGAGYLSDDYQPSMRNKDFLTYMNRKAGGK